MIEGKNVPKIRFPGFDGEWAEKKFGELYQRTIEKNDLSFGTENIISVANMYFKTDSMVTDIDYLRTYNVFRVGDIAFEGNKSRYFAHGRFVENTIGDGIVSHVFDVFRPIAAYDIMFWKYLINNEAIMGPILLRCTKSSTMMTNLVSKDFLNESIAVPSIVEQKEIGCIFSLFDQLILNAQKEIDNWKELKKGMLQKMFPKEGKSVPEIRFPGFKTAWCQKRLADMSDFITKGATPTTYGYDWVDNGIPFFRNDSIKDNIFTYGDYSFITEEAHNVLIRSEIQSDDILVAITGEIGKVGIVPKSIKKGNINQHLARIRLIDGSVPYFVYQSLCTERQQNKYRAIKTGISMAQLSLEQIRETIIPFPDKAEQECIGSYFELVDRLIYLHQRELDKWKELKKGLLQQMFV